MSRVRLVDDARAASDVTAIYVRVTREESLKTDLSIPNQRNRAIEMCGERGWLTAKVYQEPRHIGGELGPQKRPALAQMLADIKAGHVTRVLCRHTDRLWRSTEVEDLILGVLHRHTVELWDFAGPRELKSAGGRFALKVLGAAAELEKGLTGERIREMKRGKARAGKNGGGPPPFGYTSQSRVKLEHVKSGVSEDEAYRLACERFPIARAWHLDENEAPVVQLIFDLYLDTRWGARRISQELNRRGYRRRGGFPWSPVKVGKVLNNPAVAGYQTFDEQAYERGLPSKSPRYKQTLYAGAHPAIISAERWHEAQRLKSEVNHKRLRTKTAASARVYPLSGVLRCGSCGSHMRGKSGGGGKTAYYMCARRAYYGTTDGCSGPTVHQAWAEVTVWKYLDQLFQSPATVAEIFAGMERRATKQAPEGKARLEKLQSEIADLDARQRRWMDKFERTKDDAASEVIWERIHELKTRQLALAREATELEAQLRETSNERRLTPDQVSKALAKLPGLASASPEKRRALVEALERRHDLRVRLVDPRRLALSFRLEPLADVDVKSSGARFVMVGTSGRAHARPMSSRPGKTMLARRVPSILPPMSHDEALETTKVYSALGLAQGLVTERPFRAPHHTVSAAALIGGGTQPRPGEITLAHNGVLFLDEVPEFSRATLEALRQPLEDRTVTIGRIHGTIHLPASFLLVAAANPCPCGWAGSKVRECVCGPGALDRYRMRLSGPLLDRIDLQVTVKAVALAELRGAAPAEPSAAIRARVLAARERQARRLAGYGIRTNAEMPPAVMRATCRVTDNAEEMLAALHARRRGMTARTVDRLIKVARTIADLAGDEAIEAGHIQEAAGFRAFDADPAVTKVAPPRTSVTNTIDPKSIVRHRDPHDDDAPPPRDPVPDPGGVR